MSRHRLDTVTFYEYIEDVQETKDIEDPEVVPVPKDENKVQTKKVKREAYLPGKKLTEAVNLAIALGRPLLLQGDPGCGKTRLAHAVAYALGLPLEECHIKSTSRAQDLLYTYDAVNRLYDAQLGEKCPVDDTGVPRSQNVRNYIQLGPLGRAIARSLYGRRSVVLIDEIDKADIDFPNDLLLELDRLEFRIPETDEHYAVPEDAQDYPQRRPIVIVTHNEEKALPTAFLRRCIFHYVEFPKDENLLLQILRLHEIQDNALSQKAINVLNHLYEIEISKKPGLSELLDWVGYMQFANTSVEDLNKVPLPFQGVLLKQQGDQRRVEKDFVK